MKGSALSQFLSKLQKVASAASLLSGGISALFLLVLLVVTCVDVIGRYFFFSPLTGTIELVRICMAGIIFFSLPLMFLHSEHITVDLFPRPSRTWLAAALTVCTLAISIVILIVLGNRITAYAERAFNDGDVSEFLRIPQWPVVSLIAVSVFAAGGMAFLRCIWILSDPSRALDDVDGEMK